MKKIMISVMITALAVPVFSQGKDYATKGIWEIGSSVSYNSNTPEISYFVVDSFSLGFMLEYVNKKWKDETETYSYNSTTLFLVSNICF
jgi:hypothetical protein